MSYGSWCRGSSGSLGFLLVVCALVWAPTSRAEAVLLTCPGTLQATYSPGMTNTPQTIATNVSGTFGPCVGVPLTLLSASLEGGGTGQLSCLAGSTQSMSTLTWNDGTSSTVSVSILVSARPLGEVVVTYSGTVSSGRFAGAAVLMVLVLAQTQVTGCFTAQGVTATAGPVVLTITGS
ncbi:hypothetical protein SAMN05443572_105496 [Myxococcus fulvus]|uniref:Uncharacterized protein n=1 Tax=Myxococcus fulvus TaxID=33 RepID=A0A511T6V2_MYXFU|nr:hypothetical protein [Myxococcus fulvus]GEN09242.1 hypothetical protein MFU01_42790 [Myxococcus fulvus]SEU16728.1 hypothetical protein SAMN05443572_105496 [Myxococcus fulvus]